MITSSTKRSFRRRGPVLSALVVTALSCIAARAKADTPTLEEQVVVQIAHPTTTVIGRSDIGAPIELLQSQHVVDYSDLNLATDSDAKVLETRVQVAARIACDDLDAMSPLDVDPSCSLRAVKAAMPQVREAIAAARKV